MKTQTKKVICLLVAIASVLTIVSAVSYAYFTAMADVREQSATSTTGTMKLTFADNDASLKAEVLDFGESMTKKFVIRNTGTLDATAYMYWEDLVNTYTYGSLSYTLSYSATENGTYTNVVTNRNVPVSKNASRSNLATGLLVPAGATYYYNLVITLNYLEDVNQDADLKAGFNSRFALGNEKLPTAVDNIIATAKTTSPNFATIATTDEGVFSMEDDYGTSYYYRGAVTNNYVKFADKFWRIIRINGDGSLRVIYDGTTAHENGESSEDRFVGASPWNDLYDDAKYVGYMYGPANEVEGTTTASTAETVKVNAASSTIKTYLEEWYQENILATGNAGYVVDKVFCNDRSTVSTPSSYGAQTGDTGLGYGKNVTTFGYWNRFDIESDGTNLKYVNVSLKCSDKRDAFTASDTVKGNGALTYPVGLVTADEFSLAGGVPGVTANNDFYLYKGSWYWTFSPAEFDGNGALVSGVHGVGSLYSGYVGIENAVAPVINLSSGFAENMTGDGSKDNPYRP